jgi:hypothetical protein
MFARSAHNSAIQKQGLASVQRLQTLRSSEVKKMGRFTDRLRGLLALRQAGASVGCAMAQGRGVHGGLDHSVNKREETKMRIVSNGSSFDTSDLRAGLVADLAALRDGKLSGSEARTRAYVAKQVIDSMKLEIVAAHMQLNGFQPVALLEAA